MGEWIVVSRYSNRRRGLSQNKWMGCFIRIRNDERIVQLPQVTHLLDIDNKDATKR